ncbi:hypothetical protein Hdeb2414_s0007g00243611 [Helianthus debilis subsp. tardiflorus]
MGENKLKINIARFAVENSGIREQPELTKIPNGSGQVGVHIPLNCRDTRSYREVLGLSSVGGDGREAKEQAKSIIVPDKIEAFKGLARVAVVGRVVDLETYVDFDRLLRIAKVAYGKIQHMGGLSLFISFPDEGSSRLFLDSKAVWGPWFSKLEIWNGQSLPLKRVAWLRICGIPVHLLGPEMLGQLGELHGRVLHTPKSMEEEADLSMARVGVLVVEENRIKEIVLIKWKNKVFRVWVEEELDVWVTDCLEFDVGSISSGSSPVKSAPVVEMFMSAVENHEEPQQEVEAARGSEKRSAMWRIWQVESCLGIWR